MADIFDGQGEMENAVREAFVQSLQRQEGADQPRTLNADWVETPVGTLLAAGDQDHLHLLSFLQKSTMMRKAALVQKKLNARLEMGISSTVHSIAAELKEYFDGKRRMFETPLQLLGTVFQIAVWEEVRKVPFGHTITYDELANRIGKPAAFRAVAQANAQNPVAIAVPCHRVINSDGGLGGYDAGLERKRWLLDFEKAIVGKDKKKE